LDPPLELTDVLEIALEPLPIVRAQVATELADSAGHPVENAAPGAPTQSAFLGRATCSEELFERHPRIPDHGERLGRRGPADGVRVHAGIAVRAPTGLVDVLDAELHGGDGRGLPVALGVHLVQRGSD